MIVIWGTGVNGEKAKHYLTETLHVSDDYIIFCDNNELLWGTRLKKNIVYAPSEIMEVNIDMVIITPINFVDLIMIQCIDMGIKTDKLYYYDSSTQELKKAHNRYSLNIFSQDGEESFLRHKFANQREGVMVDVGANHPYGFSNSYWLYNSGWKIMNIEPDIRNYNKLKILRPNDINLNIGVSDEDGVLDFYLFPLSTFSRDYAQEFEALGYRNTVQRVPVEKLGEVFRKNGIDKINILDIDVETMEMSVLEGIYWEEVDIECILIEQLGMNLEEVLCSEINHYLSELGYRATNKYFRTVVYEKTE